MITTQPDNFAARNHHPRGVAILLAKAGSYCANVLEEVGLIDASGREAEAAMNGSVALKDPIEIGIRGRDDCRFRQFVKPK